jgi:hypothetical protein
MEATSEGSEPSALKSNYIGVMRVLWVVSGESRFFSHSHDEEQLRLATQIVTAKCRYAGKANHPRTS